MGQFDVWAFTLWLLWWSLVLHRGTIMLQKLLEAAWPMVQSPPRQPACLGLCPGSDTFCSVTLGKLLEVSAPLFLICEIRIVLVCLGCSNKITDWVAYMNRNLFLTVLEAAVQHEGASMIHSGESPLHCSQLVPSHFVLTWWKMVRDLSGISFIRHWSHSWGLHPHDLSTSQRPHLLLPSSLGVKISTYEFLGGDTNIQTEWINPHGRW